MTSNKLSKKALSKKNVTTTSVNPIYAYCEHWALTADPCANGFGLWIECVTGGDVSCDPGDRYCVT